MAEWSKEFAVVVNTSLKSAALHEFCIEEDGGKVISIKNDFIHTSEFPEYIEDTDNWLPLSRWVDQMGIFNHWSKIKVIRLMAKIIKELAIIENDEIVWVYRRS